jgi:hypothetical protein
MGNGPLALLSIGSPSDEKKYCETLLDLNANEAGFILSSGGAWNDAKAKNVRVVIASINE